MSGFNEFYAERRRLQAQIDKARQKIADLADNPTPGQQNAITTYEQEIAGLQGGISSIDADIADLQRRPVSEYDDPRDRTVIDRYGDGKPRIDHRSRY